MDSPQKTWSTPGITILRNARQANTGLDTSEVERTGSDNSAPSGPR